MEFSSATVCFAGISAFPSGAAISLHQPSLSLCQVTRSAALTLPAAAPAEILHSFCMRLSLPEEAPGPTDGARTLRKGVVGQGEQAEIIVLTPQLRLPHPTPVFSFPFFSLSSLFSLSLSFNLECNIFNMCRF